MTGISLYYVLFNTFTYADSSIYLALVLGLSVRLQTLT